MTLDLERLRMTERWIAWVRLAGVAFAIFEVGTFSHAFPPGYEAAAWTTTAVFGAGALVIFALTTVDRPRLVLPLGAAALLFDTLVVATYGALFSYEYGSQTRWALIVVVAEAALRYGLWGGVAVPITLIPYLIWVEHWRASRFGPPGFIDDRVSFPAGILLLTGVIVGWLVGRLRSETLRAGSRAAEAEGLRDELGRRADVLDAANRCARALSSSLEIEQAFGAFLRELRGLIPFDRVAIVLAESGFAQVMAAAGAGAESVFPPGSRQPVAGTVLESLLGSTHTIYREDMADARHPEEDDFLRLGLRCRLAAPLLAGPQTIGMLGIMRREPGSFSEQEVELAGLLGRLVGTAVQNIRAYEAEHKTVEELRRLSALRADFVSLVSHELRSPMAAVIGAARTLEQRWRELSPEQRESFLALIAEETTRLAALIADVLDTSRIEAGTFSYQFTDVDIGELVQESVATASVGQDEVDVHADVRERLPAVRGDRERLRQVLANLIDNAVKFSPTGEQVEVRAYTENGHIHVDVRDRGPGIAAADQKLIFEKFGRVATGEGAKPGTGLGLFIARSIAEAHGGSIRVDSAPERGAVFRLALPLESP